MVLAWFLVQAPNAMKHLFNLSFLFPQNKLRLNSYVSSFYLDSMWYEFHQNLNMSRNLFFINLLTSTEFNIISTTKSNQAKTALATASKFSTKAL